MHTFAKLVLGTVVAAGIAAPAMADITGEFITSGKTAADGAWPWQVRLLDDFDTQTGFCGGSFITEQWVLTAAHCLVDENGEAATSVVVGYGSIYQSQLQMIGSEAVFVHPAYLEGYVADVALIKLEEPVEGAAWIEVATPEREAQLTAPGSTLTVTGWGSVWDFAGFEESAWLRNGREIVAPRALLSAGELLSPDQLREVDIQLIAYEECRDSYEAFGEAIGQEGYTIAPTEICAGAPDGAKDSCYGDSGGPLVAAADNQQGYLQVGVVSWGIQCGNPALPGVYTRISEFYPWVKDTVLAN
jgi:secreted trypsin-like serine protease